MQIRSTFSGSGMMTKSVRPFGDASRVRKMRDAGEAAALFVDRAADLDRAGQRDAGAAIASAANTAAAMPAFMSHTPRP